MILHTSFGTAFCSILCLAIGAPSLWSGLRGVPPPPGPLYIIGSLSHFIPVKSSLCYKIANMSRNVLSHLFKYRQRRGLTQEELFKLSGVSRSTIAELESGSRMAREETTRKLARALKVKPTELIGGD
jgi:DNA-binding XRE family transcriptional regulator